MIFYLKLSVTKSNSENNLSQYLRTTGEITEVSTKN